MEIALFLLLYIGGEYIYTSIFILYKHFNVALQEVLITNTKHHQNTEFDRKND